ncbi:MAG TPA: hypothetical protein VFC90_04145 [Planctomycetota bacterium]|nr:hypothetical protein [Planctomycetota bacterium]
MAFILLALLLQEPTVESLVRDLGHELIEVRERAQQQLIRLGPATVPALRRALSSSDAERRARAWATLLKVDRTEREKDHDARELQVFLGRLHPDFIASWEGRPLKFEGSYFEVSASMGPNGMLIHAEVHELLRRYEGGRLGGVWFNMEVVSDDSGSKGEFERCATCSRGIIRAKRQDAGPLRVRIAGIQTWFSRYSIEFPAPQDGATQLVGDMTVEVAWPEVIIRSKEGWEANSLSLLQPRFTYELKSDSKVSKPGVKGIVMRGGRCGAGGPMPSGWCNCLGGPNVVTSNESPRQNYEIRLKGETDAVPLDAVSVIRCTVWKPIRIPIDFTVEVEPRKSED